MYASTSLQKDHECNQDVSICCLSEIGYIYCVCVLCVSHTGLPVHVMAGWISS